MKPKTTGIVLLCCISIFFAGCGTNQPIQISSQKDPGFITDSLTFQNDSPFHLGQVAVKLTLKYSDRNETYNFNWANWLKGQKQTVDLPKGLKGLQTYHLDGTAAASITDDDKRGGMKRIDSAWHAN